MHDLRLAVGQMRSNRRAHKIRWRYLSYHSVGLILHQKNCEMTRYSEMIFRNYFLQDKDKEYIAFVCNYNWHEHFQSKANYVL